MIRIARVTLALLLVAGGLSAQLGTPNPAVAASGGWKACAARPVPLPPSRPIDPGLEERIQERVSTWRENRRTRYPGLSVAVRWDDGRAVTAVSGVADSNSGRKVTPATPFALASVSKPFTAALALLLDACGVMPLSTRAASLVPYADVRSEATIEDLLRHEGGMSDWLTDRYTRMSWLIQNPNGKVGPKTAVQNLLPRGEIGDFDYSNSSFTLITLAAEKATGVSWRELLQELIIKPLGLKETAFGPVAGASRTHIWSRGKMRPFGQSGWGPTRSAAAILRGAGDLFATPRDLATFGELLWSDRLLEGSQTQLINGIANLTGLPWSYTVGSMMDRSWLGTLRTYGHTGGYSGASTTLRRIPELGVTIAVTANGMGTPGNYADDLAINLIDLLDAPAPSSAQAIAGGTGAGLAAALRANPEPVPVEAVPTFDSCGDGSTGGSGERWTNLSSGAGGDWRGVVTSMVELPNGALLVAGERLTRAGGRAVQGLASRSPATGTWTSFASFFRSDGGVADVYAMRVDAARGTLYIGGDFTSVRSGSSSVRASGIVQLNLKSGRWSPVGGGVKGDSPVVRALALDGGSGRLAVAGRFISAGGKRSPSAALWTPGDGWRAINASGSTQIQGEGHAVTISAAGAVSIAGYLTVGSSPARIARWSPESNAWRALATSATIADAPGALSLTPSGELAAGTGVGWYGAPLIKESALSGYGWETLGQGVLLPRKATWISAMTETPTGEILVGGSFTQVGSTSALRIARWSPTADTLVPIGGGLSTEPDALESSVHALAYAATRLRGGPGEPGRLCISAWSLPAPLSSPLPKLTATRRTIRVEPATPLLSGVSGFRAVARGPNGASKACTATRADGSCTISGLTPRTTYRVTIQTYAIPAGPGPASEVVTIKTTR
jgi:CubicO group peptidase (beta-lactamase class C family)